MMAYNSGKNSVHHGFPENVVSGANATMPLAVMSPGSGPNKPDHSEHQSGGYNGNAL
jgi:predicted dienelactone hydrolase